MTIEVREVGTEELRRAPEIDVSERGEMIYRYGEGMLQKVALTWQRKPWTAEVWQEKLSHRDDGRRRWDVMLGAFDGERLIGLASLRYRLDQTTAELVFLHVNCGDRRRGAAARLLETVLRLARESGAQELYVSATPTESAIGFYLRQGFRPTDRVDPELYALEPEDIHMRRKIEE